MTRTEARTWGKKFMKAGWRTVTLHESLDGGDCYVTATNGCFNRREFDSVEGASELLRNEPQSLAGRITKQQAGNRPAGLAKAINEKLREQS